VNVEVLDELARVQIQVHDDEAAEASVLKAMQLQPDRPGLPLILGNIAARAGQLDQAVQYLSKAMHQTPDEINPYLDLGQAYFQRREFLQALKIYQEAMHKFTSDSRPYSLAAAAMRENKDYTGAETMLRRAAELAPDDLLLRRQLGAIIALNLVQNSQEVNNEL
jgi:Flp pilus assembly protein TadD